MTDIKKYEAMAKLDLPESERQCLSERIKTLTDSFAALEEIDTDGAEPLVTVLDVQGVMRDDIVNQSVTRDELLSNAPEQYNGYFQVPKTVE